MKMDRSVWNEFERLAKRLATAPAADMHSSALLAISEFMKGTLGTLGQLERRLDSLELVAHSPKDVTDAIENLRQRVRDLERSEADRSESDIGDDA